MTKRFRTTIACKFCGASGLQWSPTPDGYRLFNTVPNSDGTVSLDLSRQHKCAVYREPDAAAVVPVTVTAPPPPVAPSVIAPVPSAPRRRSTAALGIRASWHDTLRALWTAGARRILLAGPPGTGKTTTALQTLETNYRVTMTEGTGVEDLLGCFQLRKQKEDDRTAVTVWVHGPVPNAMLSGKGILIDEIDKMPPEVQSLMYAVMDDKPEVMLPTGEMIAATRGYGVIATTNANLAVLPEAIIDRFDAALCAISPHPDAISHLADNERAAVVNYFRSVPSEQWQWAGKPTVRRMRSYAALRATGKFSDELSALCVFGKSGAEILSALTTAARTDTDTSAAAAPDAPKEV